jgi:hypothetical protein
MLNDLKELLEVYEKSMSGYKCAWLSSNCKLEYAPDGHVVYSQIKHNLEPSLNNDDIEHACNLMYLKKHVRVTIEKNQIMFTYQDFLPSLKQITELKNLAIELKIPLIDDVNGKVIYSPYLRENKNG